MKLAELGTKDVVAIHNWYIVGLILLFKDPIYLPEAFRARSKSRL